ncbi:MAG: hypothetical protein NUV50_04405 [Rhodospirillales bacterium]|nr:hypothetical protein [Rhodospirillales bacterium]
MAPLNTSGTATMAKLGKTLMSLFLDKKARAALEAKAALRQHSQSSRHFPDLPPASTPPGTPPGAQIARQPAPPTRDEINARLLEAEQAVSGRMKTPDRQNLIDQALKVRANKAKMLEELPEEQRRRLQALAMMSFMKSRPDG